MDRHIRLGNGRQAEILCQNCHYYSQHYLECRVHGPQRGQDGAAVWPRVLCNQYCGEFLPRRDILDAAE
jgi:hypothetical protein